MGPLGTDMARVTAAIQDVVREYNYLANEIRISKLICDGPGGGKALSPAELITYGNRFRRDHKDGAALAAKAIQVIREQRKQMESEGHRRRVWILRTLNHTAEVDLLRYVYGRRFVLLGVHQPSVQRHSKLRRDIVSHDPASTGVDAQVAELFERDLKEDDPYGQQVRDVFPMSDYFLDMHSIAMVKQDVERLASLLFGQPFVTPTRDEVAMFHAHGAALRSSDAGRQVGAVIALPTGEILATGANEVPKFGGGEYWVGDDPDERDFIRGEDYNKVRIQQTLTEALAVMKKVMTGDGDIPIDETRILEAFLDKEGPFKGTRLASLIEFGRVVHAEMAALMASARLGVAVRGAYLYTTAFPCHMCMKLIISAGIERVIFVDPYPKSLASEMYLDSVSVDRVHQGRRLIAENFVGVSWLRYSPAFRMANREPGKDGKMRPFDKSKATFNLDDGAFASDTEAKENQAIGLISDEALT